MGDYIFRVCFIDPFQGTVMAKFAKETLKAKQVALRSENVVAHLESQGHRDGRLHFPRLLHRSLPGHGDGQVCKGDAQGKAGRVEIGKCSRPSRIPRSPRWATTFSASASSIPSRAR